MQLQPTEPAPTPPTQPVGQFHTASSAPPTHPVWFHTPAPAKWPLVVGIISTIWGVFNLCAHGMTIVFWLVFRGGKLLSAMPNGGAMKFFTGKHAWIEVVATVGGAIACVLLILAGIRTIQRRPSGRPLHLWYAALFLAVLILTTGSTLLGINPALNRSSGAFKPTGNFMIANALLGFVIAGAHPTFALLWFLPRRHTPTPLPPPNPGWIAANGQWLPERPRA